MNGRVARGVSHVAGAAWVVARIVAQALELGVWLVLARRLGASDVGVLAVAMVILRLGGLVGDWGAAFRGAREVASHGLEAPEVIGLVRRRERVSLALGVVWLFGAVFIRPELALMAMVVVGRGSGRDWMALGSDRRIASVVPPLIQGAVLLVGASFADSVAAAGMVFAAAHAIAWLVGLSLNRLPSGVAGASGSPVDPWYMVAGLADQVLISGDVVILALLRTTGEAGVYSIVYRYPAAWLAVVGLAVSSAVPAAARGARDREISRVVVSRAWRRGIQAGVALVVLTPPAVASLGSVFGTDFISGRRALVILLMAAAVTTVSAPLRVLHVAYGRDRDMALVTVGAATANLIANLATLSTWGLTAAAVTTLLSQVLMLLFFVWWARREATGPGRKSQHSAVRLTTST